MIASYQFRFAAWSAASCPGQHKCQNFLWLLLVYRQRFFRQYSGFEIIEI
eukprot:jgi/Botrbrau1/3389/Bobra.0337s0030.1